MKHPYAEILHAIADGKRMQRKNLSEVWVGQSADETLWEIYDGIYSLDSYRIHPDDVEPATEESSATGALAEAEAAFRRYAEHHATKGAEQKAAENAALACKMAAALALWKPELQELQAKSGLAHRKSVQEAVADERDACAFACETLHAPESCTGVERSLWDVATLACADAIRARKKP